VACYIRKTYTAHGGNTGVTVLVQGKASAAAERGGRLRRFAAWAGVLALLLQSMMPLVPARAAIFDLELAASICHSPSGDAASDTAPLSGPVHDHCQMCQFHTGLKLLAPVPATGPLPHSGTAFSVALPPETGAATSSFHLPPPQCGPPSTV
jgi:hypothetical protein